MTEEGKKETLDSRHPDPPRGRLFADDDAEGPAECDPAPPPGPQDAAPARRRGRQPLPEYLPRERIEYELTAEELACPECGHLSAKICEEISEQLEYVPASILV